MSRSADIIEKINKGMGYKIKGTSKRGVSYIEFYNEQGKSFTSSDEFREGEDFTYNDKKYKDIESLVKAVAKDFKKDFNKLMKKL